MYTQTPDPEDEALVVNYPGVADVAYFQERDFVYVYNHSDSTEIDDILKRAIPKYKSAGWGNDIVFAGVVDYVQRKTGEKPEEFGATARELFDKQQQELGTVFIPEGPQYFITVMGNEVLNMFRSLDYTTPPELWDDGQWNSVTGDEYDKFVAPEGSYNLEVSENAVEYHEAATRGGSTAYLSEYTEFML